MKIFSPHRRKLEAKRRYGSADFKNKVKSAQNYRRLLNSTSKLIPLKYKILALGILSVLIYFLAISPYFVVTKVNVGGNIQLSSEQIQNTLVQGTPKKLGLIPSNHFWFLSKNSSEKKLIVEFPTIKRVTKYKRQWPNKIEIEILERNPGFVIVVNNRSYLIDDEGMVVKELFEPLQLPKVINQVSDDVKVGEIFNNSKLVGFIMSGSRQWPNKISSKFTEIRIPGIASTQVQFVSTEGWSVFFDINRSAESQLSSLLLIINNQINPKDRLNLAYIDLRFEKSAYYCFKNSPCEQQPQTKEVGEVQGKTLDSKENKNTNLIPTVDAKQKLE